MTGIFSQNAAEVMRKLYIRLPQRNPDGTWTTALKSPLSTEDAMQEMLLVLVDLTKDLERIFRDLASPPPLTR